MGTRRLFLSRLSGFFKASSVATFSFSLWCCDRCCKIHTFRLYIKLYIMPATEAYLNFSRAFFKHCDRGDYGRSTCHHWGDKLYLCAQRSSLRPRFFSRHQQWVSYWKCHFYYHELLFGVTVFMHDQQKVMKWSSSQNPAPHFKSTQATLINEMMLFKSPPFAFLSEWRWCTWFCFTDEQEAVQKRTFTKWINSHLAKVGLYSHCYCQYCFVS